MLIKIKLLKSNEIYSIHPKYLENSNFLKEMKNINKDDDLCLSIKNEENIFIYVIEFLKLIYDNILIIQRPIHSTVLNEVITPDIFVTFIESIPKNKLNNLLTLSEYLEVNKLTELISAYIAFLCKYTNHETLNKMLH